MTTDNAKPQRNAGFFERTVTRLLMRPARVSAVAQISKNFRLIDFQGDALRECTWTPGDKLQIKLDGSLSTRTFTPMQWDTATGATRILAYCHGAGPGCDWARRAQPGDERQLFGPRASLRLDGLPASTVLFGDETSIGLAATLQRTGEAASVRHFIFEVNDREEAAVVLESFGMKTAVAIERQPDNGHLEALIRAIQPLVGPSTAFVLSGKASSIQYVNRALKALSVAPRRLRTKVYWAPGKAGLD